MTLESRFVNLSEEATESLIAMVEHCINHRLCLGLDEGFHDNGNEREFVRELREFVEPGSTQSIQ